MTSLRLYATTLLHPRRGLEAVVAEGRPVRLGAAGVAVTATLYTLVYFFLSRNGGRPTVFRPWLAIEPEVFFPSRPVASKACALPPTSGDTA